MRENESTGLLEWGINEKNTYIELKSENGQEDSCVLADNINSSNYTVEFAVKRDYVDSSYLGVYFEQGTSYNSKLLFKTYDGKYGVSGISSAGVVDTINVGKQFTMNGDDITNVTITCYDGSTPKVFIDGVYNAALTSELALVYQANMPLNKISFVSKGEQLKRIFDWSFETGNVLVPQESELILEDGLIVRQNGQEKYYGDILSLGSSITVEYTNDSDNRVLVYANETLLGLLEVGETLNTSYVVDSLITDIRIVEMNITVSYQGNLIVKDDLGNVIGNGDNVELNEKVYVTVVNNDKLKVAKLYVNGIDAGITVVNAEQTFEYDITQSTTFVLKTENYPIVFNALSSNATIKEEINAREQGINEDGYLVGPNFNEFSATSPITLSKDAVFTTTLEMNRGYNFGVRFLIGSTEYRLLARPNFKINNVGEFRPGWMEIWKGTSLTRYILTDEVLDDEVEIKLIFDSANEKVYAFVNGQDFTSQLGVTYTSADTAKLHFYYLCEKDQEAAVYKTWSVLSGREAVEEAVSEINTTYAGTKKLVGEVNIQAHGIPNGLKDGTESTLFEATITATGNNYKAGLYFADYSTGKTDVGIYVTKDKIYGGANKNYSITSSLTHTLKINYRSDGALMVYVDGVLKTGQFMTGFTTSATKFAKFTCYVVNEGSDVATIDYHFANERKVNSDNLAYTTYTEGYNVSMEKIGELNLKSAVANDEGKYESFATTVKVPTSGFAGIMIKDDKGNYIVYGIVNNSEVRIFKPSATPPHDSFRGATFAEKGITADGEYDLLFQIENRRALKFYADLKTISTQFMDSAGGATNCGFATDATKLEIYLVWTDANTQFVY
jgi:hypothetical protein